MPVPPENFTLTPTAGSPLVPATWTHPAPATVDRFEILKRATGSSDPWERVILAPKADFGAGPYSYTLVTTVSTQFVVVALDAAGVRST